MSLWCLLLDPHLTTYHSNIGVQIIDIVKLGTSTLDDSTLSLFEHLYFAQWTMWQARGGFTLGFNFKDTFNLSDPHGEYQIFLPKELTLGSAPKYKKTKI